MHNNRRKRGKDFKRAAAVWLAGVMAVSLMGCGKAGGGKSDGDASNPGDVSGENAAMGRYMETITDVDTGAIMDLQKLADGKLVLLENGSEGRFCSADDGKTWEPDALPGWFDFIMENGIYDMKAAPDGSVAVLYRSYGNRDDYESVEDMIKNGEQGTGVWLIPAQGEEAKITDRKSVV